MERDVKVHVQKFDAIGNGRYRMKIKESYMDITHITHAGKPYITVKKLGRGRYILRKDTVAEKPVPAVPPPTREPMEYEEDAK